MCQKVWKGSQIVRPEMNDRFSFKKILYWLLYRTAEYCLRTIIFLVPRIPHRLLVLMTSRDRPPDFRYLWPYRKLMQKNVSMALSDEILPVEKKDSGTFGLEEFCPGTL